MIGDGFDDCTAARNPAFWQFIEPGPILRAANLSLGDAVSCPHVIPAGPDLRRRTRNMDAAARCSLYPVCGLPITRLCTEKTQDLRYWAERTNENGDGTTRCKLDSVEALHSTN